MARPADVQRGVHTWLFTEKHIVQNIARCAIYDWNLEASPVSSNQEPDFKSHLLVTGHPHPPPSDAS